MALGNRGEVERLLRDARVAETEDVCRRTLRRAFELTARARADAGATFALEGASEGRGPRLVAPACSGAGLCCSAASSAPAGLAPSSGRTCEDMPMTTLFFDTDRSIHATAASWADRVSRAIVWERERQRTLAELECYADHELIELGIGAGDLQRLAAQAADLAVGARPSAPLRVLAALRVHGPRA